MTSGSRRPPTGSSRCATGALSTRRGSPAARRASSARSSGSRGDPVGRVVLVFRLAVRDVRRHPVEAMLLLLAIFAASTTLTLALVLRGVTADPYQRTRAATSGPDVVASDGPTGPAGQPPTEPTDVAGLEAMADDPRVVAHSGPYPVVVADLEANGHTGSTFAIGRET